MNENNIYFTYTNEIYQYVKCNHFFIERLPHGKRNLSHHFRQNKE